MDILGYIRKVPGGLMIIPMVITAIINSFAPGVLNMGGLTTALYGAKSTLVIIGLLTFIVGTQLKVRDVPKTLQRGGILCIARLAIGSVCAWAVLKFAGPGGFLGVSALAFSVVLLSCNPGIYIALVDQYGDTVDKAAFSLLNIIAVPAATVFIMQAVTGAKIDYMSIVSTLIPFFFGMLLNNLDDKFRTLIGPATPLILISLGFCFGSSIDLTAAFKSGLSGIILVVCYLVISVPVFLLVDKLILRRPGYGGVATCSVGGIAIIVPKLLAANDPSYLPYAETATAQVAMVVLFTAFITPWITGRVVKAFGSGTAAAPAPGQAQAAQPAPAAAPQAK